MSNTNEAPMFTKLKTVFPLLSKRFLEEGIVMDGSGELSDTTYAMRSVRNKMKTDFINSYLYFTRNETEDIMTSIWNSDGGLIEIDWYWGYKNETLLTDEDFTVLSDSINWVFKETGIGFITNNTHQNRLSSHIDCEKITELYDKHMEDEKKKKKILDGYTALTNDYVEHTHALFSDDD